MKYFFPILILIIGISFYFLGPTNDEPKKQESIQERNKEIKKKSLKKELNKKVVEIPLLKKEVEIKGRFSRIDESKYLDHIGDVIKDQGKELQECEDNFDDKFNHILKLGINEQIRYLEDGGNLDNFLENLAKFNWTTPSSSKMIKELANPIASQVESSEILETVGYVKTCREEKKQRLLGLLSNFLIQEKRAISAYLTFLENEVSTLTYPSILMEKVQNLYSLFSVLKIERSRYPEYEKSVNTWKNFVNDLEKIPTKSSGFNPKRQQLDYRYALILQREIQLTLKAVKKDLLK